MAPEHFFNGDELGMSCTLMAVSYKEVEIKK
jgi:hypothetical protein